MTFPYVADCWFLTGPTAAGKSTVGIELARQLAGEIISLDSMAVYRHMDIGTAKPSHDQRTAVRHHLIDIVEPNEAFSLARYVDAAEHATAEILSRGKTPIFVGGTPLYLKAVLRGIFQGPAADWGFRERLSAEAAQRDASWLHDQVRNVDATAAARLHPQDTKRLIRVLEVFEKTGQPITSLQKQFDQPRSPDACRVFVLDWPRAELYERINARVDAMFATGLVDEVRELLSHSQESPKDGASDAADSAAITDQDGTTLSNAFSHTAAQALGYREVIEHLKGQHTLAETITLVQNRTRAFARRQLTWFRSLSECRFAPCNRDQSSAVLAAQIAATAQA